jgi:flavin reductase (DIM6/NTAB) family NADH-FMN oxidoreductase RutF
METKDFTPLWQNISRVMNKLPTPGILMATGNYKEKENLITIGWVQFGFIWSSPVISVMVRPSRYSFDLLQKYNTFTINVLSESYKKQIDFCGTNSGSYCDKFKETGLTKNRTPSFNVSHIKESEIILECEVVHTNDVLPETLSDLYLAKYYSSGDYHKIFTGAIINYKINF